MLSLCLFNFYAEFIIQNAGLDESQAGIKIVRRNINNFRYADNTNLMAESEDEQESLGEDERGILCVQPGGSSEFEAGTKSARRDLFIRDIKRD